MMEFLSGLWQGIVQTSLFEWLAVVTGVLYVIFAAKKMVVCWLFGLISSLVYIYLFVVGKLYLESILQSFYVIMAIVGWVSWNKSKNESTQINTWSLRSHALNIVVSGALAIALGYIFDLFTDQEFPYVDAFTTIFSLVATLMITQKVLENWIYWVIIDLASVYLYASRGYELAALQMFIFTIVAVYGYFSWLRIFRIQRA